MIYYTDKINTALFAVLSAMKPVHASYQCSRIQLTFSDRASCIWDRRFATLQRTIFVYLINKYISLSDIFLTVHR